MSPERHIAASGASPVPVGFAASGIVQTYRGADVRRPRPVTIAVYRIVSGLTRTNEPRHARAKQLGNRAISQRRQTACLRACACDLRCDPHDVHPSSRLELRRPCGRAAPSPSSRHRARARAARRQPAGPVIACRLFLPSHLSRPLLRVRAVVRDLPDPSRRVAHPEYTSAS